MIDTQVPNLLAGWINRRQIAKALDISERTVSRMMNQPNGLAYMEFGREKLSKPEFIEEYLTTRIKRPNRRRTEAA